MTCDAGSLKQKRTHFDSTTTNLVVSLRLFYIFLSASNLVVSLRLFFFFSFFCIQLSCFTQAFLNFVSASNLVVSLGLFYFLICIQLSCFTQA